MSNPREQMAGLSGDRDLAYDRAHRNLVGAMVRAVLIADEAYKSVTIERVERALRLRVVPLLDRGTYFVSGGHGPHYVNLRDPSAERCDCDDHGWREAFCKHLLAVLIREGDYRLLVRLKELREETNNPEGEHADTSTS